MATSITQSFYSFRVVDASDELATTNTPRAAKSSVCPVAQDAAGQMEASRIADIRNFETPPEGILEVMHCIMILLGEAQQGEPPQWEICQKFMSKPEEVVQRMKALLEKVNFEAITEAQIEGVSKYQDPFRDPSETTLGLAGRQCATYVNAIVAAKKQ